MALERIKIRNTNTGKEVGADVLERSDKRLKVALDGTKFTITLTRSDIRRPYVGNYSGMEFTSAG